MSSSAHGDPRHGQDRRNATDMGRESELGGTKDEPVGSAARSTSTTTSSESSGLHRNHYEDLQAKRRAKASHHSVRVPLLSMEETKAKARTSHGLRRSEQDRQAKLKAAPGNANLTTASSQNAPSSLSGGGPSKGPGPAQELEAKLRASTPKTAAQTAVPKKYQRGLRRTAEDSATNQKVGAVPMKGPTKATAGATIASASASASQPSTIKRGLAHGRAVAVGACTVQDTQVTDQTDSATATATTKAAGSATGSDNKEKYGLRRSAHDEVTVGAHQVHVQKVTDSAATAPTTGSATGSGACDENEKCGLRQSSHEVTVGAHRVQDTQVRGQVQVRGLRKNQAPPRQSNSNQSTATVNSSAHGSGGGRSPGRDHGRGLGKSQAPQALPRTMPTPFHSDTSQGLLRHEQSTTGFIEDLESGPEAPKLKFHGKDSKDEGKHLGQATAGHNITGTNNTDLDLMEATPVQDNDDDIGVADQVDPAKLERAAEKEQQEKVCRRIGCFIIAASLATCIILVLSVKLRPSSPPEQTLMPTLASTLAPTPFDYESMELKIKVLLPGYAKEALAVPDSPQSRAMTWLLGDPNVSKFKDQRLVQRFALATIYFATGGESWNKNDTKDFLRYDLHECLWATHRVDKTLFSYGDSYEYLPWDYPDPPVCHNTSNFSSIHDDGVQTRLYLGTMQLVGTLPLELYLLTSLIDITFGLNLELHGSISSHIGGLTNLEALTFHAMDMTGTIPTEIGLLTNLKGIFLSLTNIDGTMPTELGMLTSLRVLSIEDALWTSTIPSEIGALNNLLSLRLGGDLTGTIPKEVYSLGSLHMMQFFPSLMTGTIPTEVGLLTNLLSFGYKHTLLTGAIPSEIGQLTGLEQLVFQNNALLSTIPTSLGNLRYLFQIRIEESLTGTIPTELGNISLAGNLSSNSYTQWYKGHTPYSMFSLVGTRLTGTIPSALSSMEACSVLLLQENPFLTGSFPTEFGLLTKMEIFGLEENQLSGPIPSEMGLFSNMTMFSVRNQSLTGTLPLELAQWTRVSMFDVSHNTLTGTIPPELEDWDGGENTTLYFSNLKVSLEGNNFSGLVPPAFCSSIFTFDCSCPWLSGCDCQCLTDDDGMITNNTSYMTKSTFEQ